MSLKIGVGSAKANVFTHNHKALVGKVTASSNVKEDILRSVDLIGGFQKAIKEGDEVWLKPNFNTSDAPPGSSDTDFVKAIAELLYEHGASKVILGESSMFSLCTRKVLEDVGMLQKTEAAGAEVVAFDEGEWVSVRTGGKRLRQVSLPESALGAKKLVHVCCMKTHRWAKFTLSLKLAVGFVKPSERMLLHAHRLEEKIADLNLVVRPDLIIMDGRKCFISGGPACGELREPRLILASGDRVAIDVEAIKVIEGYDGASLTADPWSYTQISAAAELGIGVKSEIGYCVLK